ncbi:MAG: hypothetical protein ACOX4B_03720 [Bacillota bacterium]
MTGKQGTGPHAKIDLALAAEVVETASEFVPTGRVGRSLGERLQKRE